MNHSNKFAVTVMTVLLGISVATTVYAQKKQPVTTAAQIKEKSLKQLDTAGSKKSDRPAYFVALESLPINTKEIIKLKDIEFAAGDVRKQLIEACVKNYYEKCVFDESGRMGMGDYTYGNVEAKSNTIMKVHVGKSGELLDFFIQTDGAPTRLENLAELLTSKYGNAIIENNTPEKDPYGRSYKRQHFYWKDSRGTIVVIDTIYSAGIANLYYYKMGEVTIMSKAYIDKWEEDTKIQTQHHNKELENKKNEELNNL